VKFLILVEVLIEKHSLQNSPGGIRSSTNTLE